MNNRILAMLLAVIMVFSIVPVNALAAEYECAVCGHDHNTECGYDFTAGTGCTHTCTPAAPAAHTCKDEHGGVNNGPNCVCDVPGCTEEVHVYSETTRKNNGDGTHSKVCDKCGKVAATGNCEDQKKADGTAGKDCVCDWCGYKIPCVAKVVTTSTQHQTICENCETVMVAAEDHQSDVWNKGETYHYDSCTVCGVNFSVKHEDSATDDDCLCDVCGKEMTHGNYVWIHENGNVHWEACEICGEKKEPNGSGYAHFEFTYDEEAGTKTCVHCGYVTTHDHVDVKKADGTSGKDCVCDDCGEQLAHTLRDWEDHPYVEGKHMKYCTTCHRAVETGDHVYTAYEWNGYGTNTHTVVCDVCGDKQSEAACTEGHVCELCGGYRLHQKELFVVVDIPAVCEQEGMEAHAYCETCGLRVQNGVVVTEEEVTIPALEHEAGTNIYYDDNEHWRYCWKCYERGVQYKMPESIGAHEYGEWLSDATTHWRKCADCDYTTPNPGAAHSLVRETLENHQHKTYCEVCDYVQGIWDCADGSEIDCLCDGCGGMIAHTLAPLSTVNAKDPTCKETGLIKHYRCNTCENLFDIECNVLTEEDVTVAKIDHKWWPKGLDLSKTKHTEMCEYCKVVRLVDHFDNDGDCMCDYDGCTLPAHEHTIVAVAEKAATCEEEGHQAYWYFAECGKEFADAECTQPLTQKVIYGKTAHTWGEWTALNDGKNHERVCTVCEEASETKAHNFSSEAPYCVDCGAAEGLVFYPLVPATCETAGTKEHWKSSITNRSYWDAAGTEWITGKEITDGALVIPALGHNMRVCLDEGNGVEHKRICANGCGKTDMQECESTLGCICDACETPLAGHELVHLNYVAPTCTAGGHNAAMYCTKCDAYYTSTGEELQTFGLAALGHNWTRWSKEDDSEHGRRCLRCNIYEYEAHNMEVKDLTSGNLHEWYCTECSHYDEEEHYDDNGDGYCDACDHNDGQVDANVSNPSTTITIKGSSSSEKKSANWWSAFVERINPSHVGEKEAESGSVNAPASSTTGSGSGNNSETTAPSVSSGSTNVGIFRQLFQFFLGLFGL